MCLLTDTVFSTKRHFHVIYGRSLQYRSLVTVFGQGEKKALHFLGNTTLALEIEKRYNVSFQLT